jgi:CHAT domain-containing protein
MGIELSVFICYRQVDAIETAKWLHTELNNRPISISPTNEALLSVYLDVLAPAVGDWHQLHGPALERAQAFIFVASPGAYPRLGPEDWVHREIDWWIANRNVAPIIVDTTGEDSRWIPETIKERWPNSQRVPIELAAWQRLQQPQQDELARVSVERIIGGIRISQTQVVFEDLEREKARVRKLRSSLGMTAAALSVAVVAGVGLLWQAQIAAIREQQTNHTLSVLALEQAERALLADDALGARALVSKALKYDRSAEITQRADALEKWAKGDLVGARAQFSRLLENSLNQMKTLREIASPVDLVAASVETRSEIDTWLSLTAGSNEDAYPAVFSLRSLPLRLDGALRAVCRRHRCGNDVLMRLEESETHISHLTYAATNDVSVGKDRVTDYDHWTEVQSGLYQDFGKAVQSFKKDLPADIDFGLQQLQERLQSREALVEFVLYHDRYAAWVVKREGRARRIELGPARSINEDARAFANAVSSGDDYADRPLTRGLAVIDPSLHRPTARLRDVGPKLKAQIWAPLQPYLGSDTDTVFLVLDGSLATVPFAVLPGREPDTVLLQEHQLVHLSTSHDLFRPRFDRTALHKTLLVGNVTYGKNGPFLPLPGTATEIHGVASLLVGTGVEMLTGNQASERQFRRRAPEMAVLHLATHGWASPNLRRLGVAPNRGLALTPDPLTRESLDPLLRSGIAFAGIGDASADGIDDGVLSALEVRSLDLHRAQLVVLSACETVALVKAGDSFVGMVQSFLDAGASTVIASTGLVSDRSAAQLMIRFYQHLLGSAETPAAALRLAALELRGQGETPFNWAGFVIYGS